MHNWTTLTQFETNLFQINLKFQCFEPKNPLHFFGHTRISRGHTRAKR